MIKAGIKYCGHCMPLQSMYDLYDQIAARQPAGIEFSFFMNDPDVDCLIILNACTAECADSYGFKGPIIVVSPNSIDHAHTANEDMVPAIIDRIRTVMQSA